MMIYGLDLFSGIGGIGLALKDYVRTVAYCECDRYAQSVLLSRMWAGDIDRAPIWDDIRTLRSDMLPEIDIIYGGFPCQDISVAGNGRGLAGERSGLFFEIVRLTEEINPTFVFLENVPAIRTRGLREVIRAFTNLRYDCRWTCVSALKVGAPHVRKRWFMLAYSDCERGSEGRTRPPIWKRGHDIIGGNMAHADGFGLEEQGSRSIQKTAQRTDPTSDSSWWAAEPNVDRVVNGLSNRVDRIKGLGNAVVPLQAKVAFERLIGIES